MADRPRARVNRSFERAWWLRRLLQLRARARECRPLARAAPAKQHRLALRKAHADAVGKTVPAHLTGMQRCTFELRPAAGAQPTAVDDPRPVYARQVVSMRRI